MYEQYQQTGAPLSFLTFSLKPGGFARSLHDAVYLYGLALSTAIQRDPINGYNNANYLQDAAQIRFNGLSLTILEDEFQA